MRLFDRRPGHAEGAGEAGHWRTAVFAQRREQSPVEFVEHCHAQIVH